jgi:hypothetical protein
MLTLAALLGAAEPATKPVVDLSTPKAAVDTFAHALQRGDTATALAVTIPDAQHAPFITAFADCCGQEQRQAEAVAARFGAAAGRRYQSYAVRTLLRVRAAQIHLDGDRATLAGSDIALTLRKTPEGWKVDGNAMVQGANVAKVTRLFARWAEINIEITQQVKAGRYGSADEMDAAWKARLNAPAPPATAPATAPAPAR